MNTYKVVKIIYWISFYKDLFSILVAPKKAACGFKNVAFI